MNMIDTKRIFDAVYKEGNPDPSKTLTGWQSRVHAARNGILAVQKRIDQEETQLSITYQPQAVREIMQPVKAAMQDLIYDEKTRLTAELNEVMAAKMRQYRSVGLSSPSTEQINLLTALNLRDKVDEAEVSHIAAEMADNFQALKALRSIAKRSGIDFPEPPGVEQMEGELNQAREYAIGSLADIAIPNGELGYWSRCFYAGQAVGPARKFLELDRNIYSAPQAQPEQDGNADGQNTG